MDMKNTGVEVELNANIIKSNNIKWDVSLNLTHYKNEITKLATGKDPNGYATGNIWRKKEVQSMTGTCTNMQVWILTQVKHCTIVM